jgi:hypothetical protein
MSAADPVRITLHDDAYRYAYRRSRSARLAAAAAREAVEAVDAHRADHPAEPDRGADADRGARSAGEAAVLLVTAARAALERYLPPALPPRVGADDLQAALAALAAGEREFLLLHHWDRLDVQAAARASGEDAGTLPGVEAACARRVQAAEGSVVALAALLADADPARAVQEEDLGRSRHALPDRTPATAAPPAEVRTTTPAPPVEDEPPPPGDDGASRNRRIQMVVGATCLLLIVAALTTALLPRRAAGPAEETARLYDLADVVVVVAAANVQPTVIDGEVRILRGATVVQLLKGDETRRVLTVDVTGRSTLERTYSRSFFPPNQLMFLEHGEHGILTPMEGEGSVLTLMDRRAPEAATSNGDPAPLPDGLRDTIRALPEEELALETSGEPAGALDPAAVVGVRPPEGHDPQDMPGTLLGTFRMHAEDGQACVLFSFNGRAVLLRWPEGFTAYERRSISDDDDPAGGLRVLTVLNERGYPYVDENRSTPFIRGVPTGIRGTCDGREVEMWDIAVDPGSTLLFY